MANPYLDKLTSLNPDWSLGYTFVDDGADRVWKDDANATTYYDIVVSGGTERTTGGPTNDPGAKWVYFDGSSGSYGQAAEGITGMSDYTIAAFVRSPDTSPESPILSCYNFTDGDYRSWILQMRGTAATNPDDTYVLTFSTNGSAIYTMGSTSTGTPADDTWEHIVITRSSGTVTTYRNGSSVGTQSNSNTIYSTTNAFFMLATSYNSASRFQGDIYAPALWTTALSSTEVGELYAAASEDAGSSPVSIIMQTIMGGM